MSGKLTISLKALISNYRTLAEASGCPVASVVKANAYGLGAPTIASALFNEGCDTFFVATVAEGVVLREALSDSQIYVLNGVDSTTREAIFNSELTPVLNSLGQIDCWAGSNKSAALHIDTGMQRLGLSASEIKHAESKIDFPVDLLISHFARADEQDPESAQIQVAAFEQLTIMLRRQFPEAKVSMCNSAAALAGGVGDDMVRGGIALYGSNPFAEGPNAMQSVVKLEARVLQVRDAVRGSAVGYGGAYVCPHDIRLATVGVGYADGVPRLLSNRGEVVVQQQRCPIVGRVSMDMIHVDVSDIDNVTEGDWVEVLGDTIGVDEVANHAQTLGYEILTGIDAARRLERKYSLQ